MNIISAFVMVTIIFLCNASENQPVFETWEALESAALRCEGKSFLSAFSVNEDSIEHKLYRGKPNNIPGLSSIQIPRQLRLEIVRGTRGQISFKRSFITADKQKYTFGAERVQFEKYFNLLQALVYGQEHGRCVAGSSKTLFPMLSSIRVSLQTLAASFGIPYRLNAPHNRLWY